MDAHRPPWMKMQDFLEEVTFYIGFGVWVEDEI